MILYSAIIIFSLVAIVLFNSLFTNLNFFYILWQSILDVVLVVAIDAIIATIVHAMSQKKLHPFAKIYQMTKFEKTLYLKLGIKKWKDKIPEAGKYLCHFAKDKVLDPNNNEYVYKFLCETCYAGIMHFISIFLGFLIMIFMPNKLNIVLPVCVVNAVLQILPVMVQRFNRERLINLYNYNKRHSGERNE